MMKNRFLAANSFFISGILFIVAAVFIGYITYSNLDKGFIFNDEAYYLSYYRNTGESLSFDRTNYFRIFKFLYTPNIFHFRIISITTLVLSNYLLCFALFKYFNFKKIILLSFLGIFLGFETWQINNLIIQQYIGNTILTNVGVSLVLFALFYNRLILLTIAGFVLSFVLFNGNSHSIVLFPVLALLILSPNWTKKAKLLYFFGGFILGILLYFTFLDTTANFISQFGFLKEYFSFHRKQHSKTFMVLWVVYLFLNAILPVAIALFVLWKAKFSVYSVQIFDYLLGILGCSALFLYALSSEYFVFVFIVLTHLLALRFCIKKKIGKVQKYLIILLLVIPYCLSFGSQTWFHLRINVYKVYYFVLIFIVISAIYKKFLPVLGMWIMILLMTISFMNALSSKGWKDFVFKEQTEPVLINGSVLYLDAQRKKDIEDLRPYLHNQKKVIYSSNHLMGYLYILDAAPPIYYYFTLKDYITFILKKKGDQPDDYIYIESNDYPFYPKEIVPLQFVKHPENYQTVKTGRFTLYLPQNFQKK